MAIFLADHAVAAFVSLAEALAGIFVTADERLVDRLENLPFVFFLGEVEM